MIYQHPPVHAGGFFLLGGRVFPGLAGRIGLRAHDTRRLLRLRKVASGPPTTLSASGLIIAAEALFLALQTITEVGHAFFLRAVVAAVVGAVVF
jgi:hypothetical protein